VGDVPAIRNATGEFVKGVSGNPDGRPAVAREFREWCKEIMATEGRDRLLAALRAPQADYHFRVIELLAGYAYGKPKLGVELTGADGGPVALLGLTTPELLDRVRAAMSKLEG
jgi:hypothetical protein